MNRFGFGHEAESEQDFVEFVGVGGMGPGFGRDAVDGSGVENAESVFGGGFAGAAFFQGRTLVSPKALAPEFRGRFCY